jgi:hypothetical protein
LKSKSNIEYVQRIAHDPNWNSKPAVAVVFHQVIGNPCSTNNASKKERKCKPAKSLLPKSKVANNCCMTKRSSIMRSSTFYFIYYKYYAHRLFKSSTSMHRSQRMLP